MSITTAPEVTYDITLRDGAVEQVVGADAYQPEQSMTTFFRTGGRRTVDCWSVRMASFRTDQILAIRRLEEAPQDLGLRPDGEFALEGAGLRAV